jgi:hypothetical protein
VTDPEVEVLVGLGARARCRLARAVGLRQTQLPPVQLPPVEQGDGGAGPFRRLELDEGEAARPAVLAVCGDRDVEDLTGLGEELAQPGLAGVEAQIADEQLLVDGPVSGSLDAGMAAS